MPNRWDIRANTPLFTPIFTTIRTTYALHNNGLWTGWPGMEVLKRESESDGLPIYPMFVLSMFFNLSDLVSFSIV